MAADPQHAAWMAQWRRAAVELAGVHKRELRALTSEQALRAAEVLLGLVSTTPLPPERVATSGLVAQQATLHKQRT